MAGKGGGAWKVAYADFVTAMMAFFLVMWIVAQSDDMKHAIAHHFSDPFARESEEEGTTHQRPPKHPAPARITDQPEHEKEAGGSHSVLLMSPGGQRTSIGTVVHFAEESVDVDQEAIRRLKELTPLIVGKPQKIELRGHSSRRPLSSDCPYSDHWQLSYQRCQTVMAELEKLGIPRERIRLSQAAGYEPLSTPDEQLSGGGYARVEVCLLNETTGVKLAQHGATTKTRWKPPAAARDSHHSDHGRSSHSDHGRHAHADQSHSGASKHPESKPNSHGH